jgi:hypothetical protein
LRHLGYSRQNQNPLEPQRPGGEFLDMKRYIEFLQMLDSVKFIHGFQVGGLS